VIVCRASNERWGKKKGGRERELSQQHLLSIKRSRGDEKWKNKKGRKKTAITVAGAYRRSSQKNREKEEGAAKKEGRGKRQSVGLIGSDPAGK